MIKAKRKKSVSERSIPEKLFYKIGEVGRITGVEPYVLRYWESEFPFLRPRKSRSGQRLYVKKDIETILEIKKLLYDERYTIEGVKKKFADSHLRLVSTPADVEESQVSEAKPPERPQISSELADKLSHIKKRLREIISELS
ncbi:MAG: MerR family transcriptional regulator [Nitrospirae bacterium]|nr:MAG: MerR family transcriptional regulator [Nitrospirota bacterium]